MCSRLDSRSSRLLLPMIERSDVCATWPIARRVVLHVDSRTHRIRNPEIDDRVHADGHVVTGDAIFGGHGHHLMICMFTFWRRSAIGIIIVKPRSAEAGLHAAEPETATRPELA